MSQHSRDNEDGLRVVPFVMAKYSYVGQIEINPRIIEDVHDLVNAHRASINLAPMEFAPVCGEDICCCKWEAFVVNTKRTMIRTKISCVVCRKLWSFDRIRDAMSKAGKTRRPKVKGLAKAAGA